MSGEPTEDAPLAVEVVRGDPTPEEVAALLAVVGEAYAAEAQRAQRASPARSRWEMSTRSLRTPLIRERGWSGFAG